MEEEDQRRQKNVKVDPLTIKFAGVAANWHEDITDFANNKSSQNGYFTAIAENTSKGWQLRNAHWSGSNKNNSCINKS